MADIPVGCSTIQRDLDRLERAADGNLMKFNKGTAKVLTLERNNLRDLHTTGKTQLAEKQLCRKGPWFLVDNNLIVRQQFTLSAKKSIASWAALGVLPADQGG